MIYRNINGKKISLLGFGAMRLPLIEGTQEVDEKLTREMVKYAIDNGVNYFDTAFPYHGGNSETLMGNILSEYPRDSFYLATKYPGHQIAATYNPKEIFEEQLEKCGVDYFDFYLLHNVYETSMETYLDPKWGILDYFIEQKKNGRIKHLGFSSHGGYDCVKEFLDKTGDHMEFCQIQLNYLDWTLQDAAARYNLLKERNIPCIVMEPVRGGKLANLPEEDEKTLKILRPDESIAAWSFRWLQTLGSVDLILSGMSNMEQVVDNVKTFSEGVPLNEKEIAAVLQIAEKMKESVPCTACKYCIEGCPQQLDIPSLIDFRNQLKVSSSVNTGMRVEALGEGKQPTDCIKCVACNAICPQKINIPKALDELTDLLSKQPSWAEVCKEREEAAKKLKK